MDKAQAGFTFLLITAAITFFLRHKNRSDELTRTLNKNKSLEAKLQKCTKENILSSQKISNLLKCNEESTQLVNHLKTKIVLREEEKERFEQLLTAERIAKRNVDSLLQEEIKKRDDSLRLAISSYDSLRRKAYRSLTQGQYLQVISHLENKGSSARKLADQLRSNQEGHTNTLELPFVPPEKQDVRYDLAQSTHIDTPPLANGGCHACGGFGAYCRCSQ